MYPDILRKLIESLSRLPGIGAKSAERLALFIATYEKEDDIIELSEVLKSIKSTLKPCTKCNLLTDSNLCNICSNPLRDHSTIMVVAESKDAYSIESTQTYKGLYHVLNGVIDFSRGIEPEKLNMVSLIKRCDDVKEVIIATNSTVEGELTATYIKTLLEKKNVVVSRLGYGLPVGADLKYADSLTLIKAVENRKKYQ